jgi:hypothetical protein
MKVGAQQRHPKLGVGLGLLNAGDQAGGGCDIHG